MCKIYRMRMLDCVGGERITPTESREVFTVNIGSESTLDLPKTDPEAQSQDTNLSQNSSRQRTLWRIFVDLPLLLGLIIVITLAEFTDMIPNHKSGFYCNDPALSFNYTGDTVSAGVLIASVLLTPLLLIFTTEVIRQDRDFSIKQRLKGGLRATGFIYKCCFYGLIGNLLIMEIMKIIVGNPRPNFFDVCKPDTAATCNGTEFVSTFECTSSLSKFAQRDSYLSFPSGHSSLSVHTGLFMAWYLQRRAFSWSNRSSLFIPTLQLVCLCYSAVCCLTRITDRRHHWWDVLAGVGIGVATALYSTVGLLNNLPSRRTYEERQGNTCNTLSRRCLTSDSRYL